MKRQVNNGVTHSAHYVSEENLPKIRALADAFEQGNVNLNIQLSLYDENCPLEMLEKLRLIEQIHTRLTISLGTETIADRTQAVQATARAKRALDHGDEDVENNTNGKRLRYG